MVKAGMTMNNFLSSALRVSACLLLVSCSPSVYKQVYPTLLDGRYDSEFPYNSCSSQLEEISETVKCITTMAHYKSYAFPLSDSVRISDITKDFLDRKETNASYQHYSVSGSGTVVYSENGKIALLTCAHVCDFSDTLITRYVGPNYLMTPFIRSIAIKMNQLVFLNEVAGGVTLDLLAFDRAIDLAILGQKLNPIQSYQFRVFMYPLGRAKELEWGSFVYLFGYPAGYRMITKGIVSLPSRAPQGSFIIDAVVSPGSSGSIALAIRDGVPHFELVGIVKMMPAQTSYVLTPSKDGNVEYDPLEPYHGEVFVERKTEIQQGIALAIPTETIVSFIQNNLQRLAYRGYDLRSWIIPRQKEVTKQ